jgi:hypothetical protein
MQRSDALQQAPESSVAAYRNNASVEMVPCGLAWPFESSTRFSLVPRWSFPPNRGFDR